jgi:hypothetical protein
VDDLLGDLEAKATVEVNARLVVGVAVGCELDAAVRHCPMLDRSDKMAGNATATKHGPDENALEVSDWT